VGPPGYGGGGQGPDPNAPYGIDPKTGVPFSDKEKLIAGLLQIFLGSFAIGRFYTGHIGLAIAQLCVTWLTCGVGALWPFIDGIMMLTGNPTDAKGRPLRG
jgi:TM2 domain-containing membrane protein YozV